MTSPTGRPMPGYEPASYGDRFAEVYDDWYADVTDTDACVATVADLARQAASSAADATTNPASAVGSRPRVLELGVGTGRLAIPLTSAGIDVTGVDVSQAMLTAMAAKPGGGDVRAVLGDMADPPVGDRRFHAVLIAYNTLFNLVEPGQQERCVARVARLLEPGGALVVEAFVPDPDAGSGDAVTTRQVTADRVVLSVSRTDVGGSLAIGQYVDITEQGIKLRPWQIRWSSPSQVDAMAVAAGLVAESRWSDWDRTPFGPDAPTHVSVYRRPHP